MIFSINHNNRCRPLVSRVRILGSSDLNPSTPIRALPVFLIRHLGTLCRGRLPLLRRLTSVPVPSTAQLTNHSPTLTLHHQPSSTPSRIASSLLTWTLSSAPVTARTTTVLISLHPWTCQYTLLRRGPHHLTVPLPTLTAKAKRYRPPTPTRSCAGSETPSPPASTARRRLIASRTSRRCWRT